MNRHDLVGLFPTRGHHHRGVALFFADQGAGNGGADIDQPEFQVGLVFADDLVGHTFAGGLMFEFDRGTKHHTSTGVERGRVNHLGCGQLAFDFLNPAFDKALSIFGSIVFGVFTQIPLRAGL